MIGLRAIRLAIQSLLKGDSPRHWGAGFALGMWLGLVPKDNLTSAILMTLICVLNVNLAAGMFSALLFGLLSPFGDPLFHTLGQALLANERFHSAWVWLFNQPLVPWTNLNNTVVLGSFLTGLALLYPVGVVATRMMHRVGPKVNQWLQRCQWSRILSAAEMESPV